MNTEESKALAQQLRKPEGEFGLQVGERMNQGNQYMNRNTIEALHLSPGDHVLEIGMGNGHFVHEIFEKYGEIKYTGCDFSELMVAESIKANAERINSSQAKFLVCNANELPVADNSISKIFTINTLHFWEDPAHVLSQFKRVLQPNGELLITIRPKEYMQHFEFTQFGFTMYSKQEAVDLLEKNGFTIVEVISKTDPPIEMFGVQLEPESLIIIAKPI